jgi:tetratricopeptide (TPR) repeat protein
MGNYQVFVGELLQSYGITVNKLCSASPDGTLESKTIQNLKTGVNKPNLDTLIKVVAAFRNIEETSHITLHDVVRYVDTEYPELLTARKLNIYREFNAALKVLDQRIKVLERNEDYNLVELSEAYLEKSQAYYESDLVSAFDCAYKALAYAEKSRDRFLEANAYFMLGNISKRTGIKNSQKYSKNPLKEYYQKALEITRLQLNQNPAFGTKLLQFEILVLINLADYNRELGLRHIALHLLSTSLGKMSLLKRKPASGIREIAKLEGEILAKMAHCYYDLDRVASALQVLHEFANENSELRKLSRDFADMKGDGDLEFIVVNSFIKLASMTFDKMREECLAPAIFYLKLLEEFNPSPYMKARIAYAWGSYHHVSGNFDDAIKQLEISLGHFEDASITGGAGVSYLTLGKCWLQKNEFGRALKCFERAKDMFEDCGNRRGLAHASYGLAKTFFSNKSSMDPDRLKMALKYLDESLKFDKECGGAKDRNFLKLRLLAAEINIEMYEKSSRGPQSLAQLIGDPTQNDGTYMEALVASDKLFKTVSPTSHSGLATLTAMPAEQLVFQCVSYLQTFPHPKLHSETYLVLAKLRRIQSREEAAKNYEQTAKEIENLTTMDLRIMNEF